MTNKSYYNNPVFTMPAGKEARAAEGNLPAGKYIKGLPGSYDESFFKDPVTGQFRFPDYTSSWKGLVKLKDVTDYKDGNSIETFEYHFFSPVFEIPDFETFLEQLPAGHFPDNINGEKLYELFVEYNDFANGSVKANDYFERFKEPLLLVNAGLMEKIDLSRLQPAHVWEEIAPVTVDKICIANNIKPVSSNGTNIKKLVEMNIPFPYEFYKPTPLLKELYTRFTTLYIDDIKTNTDHFHPLYFEPLWEEVQRSCGNDDIEDVATKILNSKFWKKRLFYDK